MNTMPCSVSRDELKHDLQSVEYTDAEIRQAELDAVAEKLRVVHATAITHEDGRTIVSDVWAENDLELKEITGLLHYGYATGDHDDAEIGRLLRKAVEASVHGRTDFQDAVDRELARNREAAAEAARLDREEF